MSEKKEKLSFQTEVNQMMELMIHSLYSQKEIFIRELLSNASDALDKLRYQSLTDKEILPKDTDLKISIEVDSKEKIITIIDNGIGMDHDEIVNNIGTIAKSGSKAFFENLTGDDKKDVQLIGQFGVGFYSVFMVSDKVILETKRAGSDAPSYIWESDGKNGYSITESDKKDPGTKITIHLKKDESEFLEEFRVKSIIRKYSDYVSYPITAIITQKKEDKEEVVNSASALWTRSKNDITDEQYNEFYKHISHDTNDALTKTHISVEGVIQYKSILYIPEKAPYDMFMNREMKGGVSLYVKRVFILDDCEDILPPYLRFIKGVVDCDDLPLNVSREMLQKNVVLTKIRKQLTKKVFDMLTTLAKKEPAKYLTFYKELGMVLKEGLASDMDNKDTLAKLLRYPSTFSTNVDEPVSLENYVSRMKEDQKTIYYITGSNLSTIEKSPHLEVFKEKGIEVLFMTDPVDEWVISSLTEFDTKQLQSVVKGELDLGKETKKEKKEMEKTTGEMKDIIEYIKTNLKESVEDVRLTTRLNESPSCLVSGAMDMNPQMEQYMRAMNKDFVPAKKILEINASHNIIKNIFSLHTKDKDDARLSEWVSIVYDQALIAEGSAIKEPATFVKRINKLLEEVSAVESN